MQGTFDPVTSSIDYIRTGKLRALAVTTEARSEVLSELATVSEFLPGYEASLWSGFGAPRGTSTEIVEKLNMEINAGLADPNLKSRFVALGGTVLAGTSADFGKLIAEETEKWGKVVRTANIKPD
jgi:tripartite-type tricarboxylate transporter receptor subunit TctC